MPIQCPGGSKHQLYHDHHKNYSVFYNNASIHLCPRCFQFSWPSSLQWSNEEYHLSNTQCNDPYTQWSNNHHKSNQHAILHKRLLDHLLNARILFFYINFWIFFIYLWSNVAYTDHHMRFPFSSKFTYS